VTVIQLALLAAVQPHDPPVATVMVLLVEADAPTDWLVGGSVNTQAPACVTFTVCPATVRLPDRWLVEVFAATENVAVPLPAPLAPAVTVIHAVLLTAVHMQPAPAVTVTLLLVEADAPTEGFVGVTPYVQGTLHENGFDSALLDVPPGPTAVTSATYVRPGCGSGLKTVARLTRIIPSDCGTGFPSETTWSGVVAPDKYNSSW